MLRQPDDAEPATASHEPGGETDLAGVAAQPTRGAGLPALPYAADASQFGALVHQQLAECRRWNVPLAVLSLGVDRIHLPHERHAATLKAQVLQEAGQRLRARVRATDLVVRVGRDGFGVVLHDATPATARNVEMRLTQALHMPYRIGSMMLALSVHTGFAVYPQGGTTGEALVLAAERARGKSAS